MKFSLALAMVPADHLIPLARAAEESGWDAVTMPDSVFYPEEVSDKYPYTSDGRRFWHHDTPFVEPFVAIPAMAAVTERLVFYTNVYKTVLRNPLLLAKTVGSAAAMADGRVGIGLGLSWLQEEFDWTGQVKQTRGARLDETVEILRRLLGGGYAEFHGEHYDFDRLSMAPWPSQPVPIYIGGHSDAALRRAARVGDGWISVQMTPEDLDEVLRRLWPVLDEHGRDRATFEVKVTPLIAAEVDGMAALAERGVTDVMTVPWFSYGGDHKDLQVQLDSVRRFADEVIQPLAAREGA
ncbi:MAG TPA: TIGR03619 family F420-dependent LLM class oxidoreductase [Acidimicrobiales bacterium]|nr:TIGR03619 family F420-dependent LLM class oxidoreductase [Acidimicrobiales bacterium]